MGERSGDPTVKDGVRGVLWDMARQVRKQACRRCAVREEGHVPCGEPKIARGITAVLVVLEAVRQCSEWPEVPWGMGAVLEVVWGIARVAEVSREYVMEEESEWGRAVERAIERVTAPFTNRLSSVASRQSAGESASESAVQAVVGRILWDIARHLRAQRCPDCRGQNVHEQCEAPDVARAIESVVTGFQSSVIGHQSSVIG